MKEHEINIGINKGSSSSSTSSDGENVSTSLAMKKISREMMTKIFFMLQQPAGTAEWLTTLDKLVLHDCELYDNEVNTLVEISKHRKVIIEGGENLVC